MKMPTEDSRVTSASVKFSTRRQELGFKWRGSTWECLSSVGTHLSENELTQQHTISPEFLKPKKREIIKKNPNNCCLFQSCNMISSVGQL